MGATVGGGVNPIGGGVIDAADGGVMGAAGGWAFIGETPKSTSKLADKTNGRKENKSFMEWIDYGLPGRSTKRSWPNDYAVTAGRCQALLAAGRKQLMIPAHFLPLIDGNNSPRSSSAFSARRLGHRGRERDRVTRGSSTDNPHLRDSHRAY